MWARVSCKFKNRQSGMHLSRCKRRYRWTVPLCPMLSKLEGVMVWVRMWVAISSDHHARSDGHGDEGEGDEEGEDEG